MRVGSAEFNEDQKITVGVAVDQSVLAAYNQKNGTSYTYITREHILWERLTYTGTTELSGLQHPVRYTHIGDRKIYALPLRIASVSSAEISEIMSSVVVVFYVDDLEGWYTVDRLSKNGEPASSYRQILWTDAGIRRTGAHLGDRLSFVPIQQVKSGQEPNGSQYISLDPATKQITIKQGSYPSNNHLNEFNITTNELHIEYHYPDWPGWWNHERMYNWSLKR